MAKKASAKEHMETNSTQVQTEKIKVIDLDKEWEKCNKKLQVQQTKASLEGASGFQTPKQTQQIINPETTIQGVRTTQDIESSQPTQLQRLF